jgi:hypothetical protein
MRANELISEMGWGADNAADRSNKLKDAALNAVRKYSNKPELARIGNYMYQMNWSADAIDQTLQGRGQHNLDWWAKKVAASEKQYGPQKDWTLSESTLRDKEDYTEKLKSLLDLSKNKDVDQRAVQQRKLDLDKEAKSKGIKEAIDQDEYTDEADMVQNNLATIIRVAEELSSVLDDNEDMAEWAQEKIAIVKSMIVTVTDYVISQHEQGNVQHTDEDVELDEKTSPKLCRSTKRLGRSDYSSCVSQGLRAHTSKGKGHTDGHGNYLKGKKAKSTQYGGDVPDYS